MNPSKIVAPGTSSMDLSHIVLSITQENDRRGSVYRRVGMKTSTTASGQPPWNIEMDMENGRLTLTTLAEKNAYMSG
jgi:hypothetical protein